MRMAAPRSAPRRLELAPERRHAVLVEPETSSRSGANARTKSSHGGAECTGPGDSRRSTSSSKAAPRSCSRSVSQLAGWCAAPWRASTVNVAPVRESSGIRVSPSLPPGRQTRASSDAARSRSAAKMTPNAEATPSSSPSANGSSWASPCVEGHGHALLAGRGAGVLEPVLGDVDADDVGAAAREPERQPAAARADVEPALARPRAALRARRAPRRSLVHPLPGPGRGGVAHACDCESAVSSFRTRQSSEEDVVDEPAEHLDGRPLRSYDRVADHACHHLVVADPPEVDQLVPLHQRLRELVELLVLAPRT